MSNDEMRREWTANSVGWVEHEAIFDSVFEPVTEALLGAIGPVEHGSRLLDVGCGSGTLLVAAEAQGAAPVGVDISDGMVEGARRRAPSAVVLVADAQEDDLLAAAPGAPFGHVVSRFGVMFFSDPVAAFANIRAAAAPGAHLTFACWRTLEENPMFGGGFDAMRRRLPPPAKPIPGAPGPTAFADPDRLRSLLGDAGWEGVAIDPLDFTCDYSGFGTEGIEERIVTVLGSTNGRLGKERLEAELGRDGWETVLDEIRSDLRATLVDGAIRFPGACWLVQAQNPAS